MKLLKALYWFYFSYQPNSEYSHPNFQLKKLGILIIIALLAVLSFLIEGIFKENVKQIWGCGIATLFLLIPTFILSMTLLGSYQEYINDKNN